MKISILAKYTLFLFIIILLAAVALSIYTYFNLGDSNLNIIYQIIVPISLAIISFLYSRKIKKNGWLRGGEIWLAYFIIINIISLLGKITGVNIIFQLVYIPVCLLGGILGVNAKNRRKI